MESQAKTSNASFPRPHRSGWNRRRWALVGVPGIAVTAVLALVITVWPIDKTTVIFVQPSTATTDTLSDSTTATQGASPSVDASVGSPAPAASGLPTITYSRAPSGFPADPSPTSTEFLTEAAHPTSKILAYDAPGGTALAYIAPTINGVAVNMPIVDRRSDWIAVLLPSANRTIAWLAPNGWTTLELHDQLVIRHSTHQLIWYRDGEQQQVWTVTLGASSTPTPLGRTFVLGQSTAESEVYAGLNVMALGNLPDEGVDVPSSLKGAHIGIHSWYTTDTFGKSVSNGCIRVPQEGQKLLLSEIPAGTEVVVAD